MGMGGLATTSVVAGVLTPSTIPVPAGTANFWTHRLYANYTRSTVSEQWPEIKAVRREGAWESKDFL